MQKARVVAFDLDGTLLDGQSGTLIVKYLIRQHFLKFGTILTCMWWGIRYKLHLPHRQNTVRECIFRDLAFVPADQIQTIMNDFHQRDMVPRYREEGLAELHRRLESGDHVVIISATFDQIARAAKAYLGVEHALATIMEQDEDGWFTGEVKGLTTAGPEKVRRIEEWGDEMFGEGCWELVAAYGDHYTDIPMLSLSQEAFAVNPGPTLAREAERRDWKVLSWR